MKAVCVVNSGSTTAKLSTEPIPQRKENEALVKVTRAGICNTDLEILKGYNRFQGILGHEFIGVIAEIDENNTDLVVGTRVVGEINLACEKCQVCKGGGVKKRNHCPNRIVLGILNKSGTFAEYLTLPIANLYSVPDSISDSVALFCEPLAAAYRIVEQVQTSTTDKIAVIGDGKLGNLITQVMTTQPHANVTHFGRHQSKLDKVPQENVEKVLVDDAKTIGDKFESVFDVCIEASGSPGGLLMAGEITRSLGTIVLKSTCAAGSREFNTATFVVKEINIVGSRCGNFRMALDALNTKQVLVEQLIDQVFPLDQALEALDAAAVRGAMKIQLVM